MNEIAKSLTIVRRGSRMGSENRNALLMRGNVHDLLAKKPIRTRQAELDRTKLEKIGRALATDKVAFDIEMKRRREEEEVAKDLMQDMGFKTVEQMKEEGMQVELRNSTEVLERVALQTLNKQFAQRLIAQRHTLKTLTDQHGHMKLDLEILTKSVLEDDKKWKQDDACVNIGKWERNALHLRDLMAKAKVILDSLTDRINKDRAICTLHGGITKEGRIDILNHTKELEHTTNQIRKDYSTIQKAESQIKEISSELAVEVNLFKNGYKEKRNMFERNQRHQKNRTFEDILEEDFGSKKITPAARRMMFKAAAESAKLKRGKERLLHSKRKQKQYDIFFGALKKATGIDEISDIVAMIVESNERDMRKIEEHSSLETEISEHMKSLTTIKREYMEQLATGSSAKMLARQRQAKLVEIRVSKMNRATSKHTVALENARKVLDTTTKNVMDILKVIKPSSTKRLMKFAKQHGVVVGNEAVLAEALGEVDLWITTTKRILTHTNGGNGSNNGAMHRRKRTSILLGQPRNGSELFNTKDRRSSYAPGGLGNIDARNRSSDTWKRKRKKKFLKPEAPSIESIGVFAADEQGDKPKPIAITMMKSQCEQMLDENAEKKSTIKVKHASKESRRSSMGSFKQPRRSSLFKKG